tara:strand:- start:46 stop:162 length:117 start_codon:yes stop_codon:yes gene_type:complete
LGKVSKERFLEVFEEKQLQNVVLKPKRPDFEFIDLIFV